MCEGNGHPQVHDSSLQSTTPTAPSDSIAEAVSHLTVRPAKVSEFSIPFKEDFVIRNWLPRDAPHCERLISDVLTEYGLTWEPLGADADAVNVQTAYQPGSGEFWVVEDISSAAIVGTAGFRAVPHRSPLAVEIRKMFLSKSARSLGLGAFLLDALEHRAMQLGFRDSIIETATVLVEAGRLYERANYLPSTGVETKRADTILSKALRLPVRDGSTLSQGGAFSPLPAAATSALPSPPPLEVVDRTRGWSVCAMSRSRVTGLRLVFRAVAVLVQCDAHVLVHRRAMSKATFPGRMAALVTGCVDWGEDPLTTARREVLEEVGIDDLCFTQPFEPFFSGGSDASGRILFHPYVATGSFSVDDIVCAPDEVECGSLMTREEIAQQGIGGSLWAEFRKHGL